MTQHITALGMADRSLRAHYCYLNSDGEVVHRKDNVYGWGALGEELYPVRVEALTGRGVLVGSRLDPDQEHLMAVLTAGEDLADVPGVDARIRQMVLEDVEVRRAQA